MRYVTAAGIVLEIGRVERRLLDDLALPEPQPPTRAVETWGGVTEQVPVYDDPGYQGALLDYHLRLGREMLNVLAGGVTMVDAPAALSELEDLRAVLPTIAPTSASVLRYLVNDTDRAAIVQEILYQSTVTQRGIDEAAGRFNYKWRDKPLLTWNVPTSYGERGKQAVEWRAALRSGLTWAQFCALPGAEQAAHVAFWMLEDKLAYLVQAPA